MNKKFSTLLAAALVAGSFSANAQIATPVVAHKVEAGYYYHIGTAAAGNLLSATKHEGKDSIRVKSALAAVTTSPNGIATVADLDSTLWLVTETNQSVTGKKVYSFVNKATNAKLQFAKKGNAVVAAGLDEWTWDVTTSAVAGATKTLVNVKGGKSYSVKIVAGTTGAEVVTVTEDVAGTDLVLMKSGDIKLTAAQLNDANSDYFKLAFADDIAGNVFTKYNMKAIPAGTSDGKGHLTGNSDGTDSVYVQVIGAPGLTSKWNDKVKNDTLFMIVDTTFHEIGSASWAASSGFKLGMDTLTNVTNTASVMATDTLAAGERNIGTYKFLFLVNKGKTSGDSLIVKVNAPDVSHGTASTAPANEKVVAGAYLSWGFIGNAGTKVLTTALTNEKLPLVSFLEGTKVANLDVTKAYFIHVEKVGVAANKVAREGKDMIAALAATAPTAASYEAEAASALVPATQWSVAKNSAGNYTFTNRDVKGVSFTTAIYAAGDKYVLASQGKDTVKLAPVVTEGKYVGYKHLSVTDEKNLAVALQFNTALGTKAYVYVADGDSVLKAKDTENPDMDAIKFKLETVSKDKAFGADSLVRSAYILKENFGSRVLGYDTSAEVFKLTEREDVTSDTVAVVFRATKNADEYQIILAKKDGTTQNTTGSTYNAVDFTADVQATVSGSKALVIEAALADDVMGYFTLHTPAAPEYLNIVDSKPGHRRMYSTENTTLAIGMGAKGEGMLKAVSELKADAFAADDFKMLIDTACMNDEAKPLFYIRTAAKIDSVYKAEGVSNYLSIGDKGKLAYVPARQFGVEKDTILYYDVEDMAAAKKDTVDVSKSKSVFAFRATPTTGAFLIEAVKTGECLAQSNGVLFLTSPDNALTFGAEVTDSPVANEDINTTVVSVVAGEGQVVIKNAEDKTVAISNILGQTLVNTVLTSDNATISVPAGIVVVAVEGEAAVKVVVR